MTRDTKASTSNVSPQTNRSFSTWARDQLYDIIYTEGDFALQMVGDLFRGYEPQREINHLTRQMRHQERRVASVDTQQSSKSKNANSVKAQKPLSKKDRQAFLEILKREAGEGQIEYWKRKKWMLKLPTDAITELISRRQEIEKQATSHDISVEAYNIAQTYQQRLAAREERKQIKQRITKRYRKRGR